MGTRELLPRESIFGVVKNENQASTPLLGPNKKAIKMDLNQCFKSDLEPKMCAEVRSLHIILDS